MENTKKSTQLLTKINLFTPRSSFYLGVSTVLLLGGCEMPSAIKNLTGGGAPSQHVDGVRRTPALNVNPGAVNPGAGPAKIPPMVTSVPPEKMNSAISNPYDQYDSDGNEISADYDINATPRETVDSGGNFFTRLFGYDESAPKQDAVKNSGRQDSRLYTARKPLPGNPYLPKDSQATPLLNMPVAKPVIEHEEFEYNYIETDNIEDIGYEDIGYEDIKEYSTITREPAKEPVVKEPVAKETLEYHDTRDSAEENINTPASDETLLGRMTSRFTILDSTEGKEKPVYPEISSVPLKPEEFDTVKSGQKQKFDELESDHDAAQQEKMSLDREVSGSLPAELPTAIEQPASPSVMEEKPSVSMEVVEQNSAPLSTQLTEENTSEEVAQPVTIEEKPSFFERLKNTIGFTEKEPVSESVNENESNNENIVTSVSSPLPVTSLDEVDIKAPSEKPEYLDLKPQASFEPVPDIPNIDDNTSALPSPDIIKTMRPSRYEVMRSKQNPAY